MKAGLDAKLARAGGECKVENSHGNPLRRSPRRRVQSNNNDSHAERDFALQTDEDLAGPNDRSMVGTHSIMYKPSPDDGSYSKGVYIGNLPQDIDYQKLLAKVRGGYIISAILCNTTKIKSCYGQMYAFVVFIKAESARTYVRFANKHGICFDSQKAVVGLVDTPTFPLSLPAKRRIELGQTRYLIIEKFHSELSLARIARVINTGVNKYRADAIERFWKDEDGNVRIRFASINAASMAYWRLDTDLNYNRLKIRFEKDPCAGPLSDLLTPPKGRRVSNFVEMKVNYDGEDDSEDQNTNEVKPSNLPPSSKVNNVDEIELDDDDDESLIENNKVVEIETAKESNDTDKMKSDVKKITSDEVQTTNEGKAVNDLKTSAEAKVADLAMMADDEPAQSEGFKGNSGSNNPDASKNEVLTRTADLPRPQDISDDENSPMVEKLSILESVRFPPTITKPSRSHFNESSSIAAVILTAADGGVEPWANNVNEAAETGTLDPATELKPVLPPTTLIGIDGEPVCPVISFLPTTTEEDLLMCESVGEEVVTETLMEALVAGSPIDELPTIKAPVVEVPITETSVEQSFTTAAPANLSSAKTSPVEAAGKLIVKLPSSTHSMIPDKFDLGGTGLDPVLLPHYVFDKLLSGKPRGGLSSSRWAHPETKATAPIIIEAPVAVPTLADSIKPASELLFGISPSVKPIPAPHPDSLAPANAPKGPRAGVPYSRWVDLEGSHKSLVKDQLARIQKTFTVQAGAEPNLEETAPAPVPKPVPTGPESVPCRRLNGPAHSRYSSLDLDTTHPRSSLRNFYAAVDLQAAPLQKPGVAVQDSPLSDALLPNAAGPAPVTPAAAKTLPATPGHSKQVLPLVGAAAECAAEAPSGVRPTVKV